MVVRNIDKMYYNFGYGKEGQFCHECQHFRKECWNKQATKKLTGYDNNGNEVIERESFLACGLFDKPFPNNNPVMDGQIEMDFEHETEADAVPERGHDQGSVKGG